MANIILINQCTHLAPDVTVVHYDINASILKRVKNSCYIKKLDI